MAMRATLCIALMLACLLIGCSRSGDVGAFIVTEVIKRGGHTKPNVTLSKLDARWKVLRDKNGFQATVTEVPFSTIDRQMRQVFGTPSLSGTSTGTQPRLLYSHWAAADIGVALQLIERPDGADVICVRAMGTTQMLEEMAKPWWRKLW